MKNNYQSNTTPEAHRDNTELAMGNDSALKFNKRFQVTKNVIELLSMKKCDSEQADAKIIRILVHCQSQQIAKSYWDVKFEINDKKV